MQNSLDPKAGPNGPSSYRIKIDGHIGDTWTEWFSGMRITRNADGSTLISGRVADQAALHGLLKKVRDLGLPLISVIRAEDVPERRKREGDTE